MALTEQAIAYSRMGMCVLPVRPFEKRPYMSNWHKYIGRKSTEEEITLWFGSLSGAGIGAVTGRVSGFVVLDVDTRYEGDVSDLLEKYPTGMVARSGSGGLHLYYSYPEGFDKVPNRVNVLDGVDVRGDGGFIVLPPTIHQCGEPYTWVEQGEMSPFPAELVATKEEAQRSQEKWLVESLRGVSSGERNNTAARLAGYFFSKGMTEDVVTFILQEWNQRNDPPLHMNELLTTIRSIKSNHSGAKAQVTEVEFVDDRATPGKTKTNGAFSFLSLRSYLMQYGGEGVSWMVDDWLPMSSIAFMVSPPESYKTWILIDLAVSVATGTPFLGKFQVNQTGPVLVIQQEDSHSGISERISLVLQSRLRLLPEVTNEHGWPVEAPILPDVPIYIHPDRMLRFDNKPVMDALEEVVKQLQPAVVLIDPLYSATSTNDYMAEAAEHMLRLKTMRDTYGCSFVIAHHSKKNADPDSLSREDLWGSQFLNAFLEVGWQIRRSGKLGQNEVVVRRHSKTMGNIQPVVLAFDISTHRDMRYNVDVKSYSSSGINLGEKIGDILFLLQSAGKPMSQADIADKLGKSRSTISRQMKKLEEASVVRKTVSGDYEPVNTDIEEGE